MSKHRPYPSLKHWRDAHGFNQEEAAQKLGISQNYYSRLERQVQAPHAKKAQKITEVTGVPLEVVLGLAS